MPCSLRFNLRSIQGCGLPDGRCLPRSGVSDRAIGMSPNFSCYDKKLISNTKFLSLKCASRRTSSVVCNAGSSRQNKHGFSRNENSLDEDRDGHEDFEDTSKDATPGHSENEIVDLFLDVRYRFLRLAATMEERKIKESKGKCEEDESFDSDSDYDPDYDPRVLMDRYLLDLERKEEMQELIDEITELIELTM